MENTQKNILVAPLNWGLGHATRCIPIIKKLERNGFTPIIASDGDSLALLKKEFPKLTALELPSYHITYPKKGWLFRLKMIQLLPKILKAIKAEKKLTKKWVTEYKLKGIISDNRYGVFNKKVPSVFITHQLSVLSGNFTKTTSLFQKLNIQKFNECWVPDFETTPNLSGDLGHSHSISKPIRYIGPLSRFKKMALPVEYDLLVLLSGPEPQRGILEKKLKKELHRYAGKTLFIKGIIESEQKIEHLNNITFYNFMTSSQLEKALNESALILCRSGYSSIMDVTQLGKKAFFIPTPGQFEQEYLAYKLKKERVAPFANQSNFRIENLMEIDFYKVSRESKTPTDWEALFKIFT